MSNYLDEQVREARDILWEAGILHWKLDACQLEIYRFFKECLAKTVVINASRRLGKSYVLLTLALEICIQKPGTIIKYIQPTRDMIKDNLNPDFERMLEDCPLHLRPVYKTQGNVWVFPNGSRINIAGTDGKNYNKLRGGNADLCIVDEAGFCSDLNHIINSILIPLTTLTKGRILLSSTTPTEPDHEFLSHMLLAEQNGSFIRRTILDAVESQKNDTRPRITMDTVHEIIASLPGGIKSDAFKTEYMCELARTNDAVLPEWDVDTEIACIKTVPRPIFADNYVGMDVGFIDMTVVLFAYWNFDLGKLVIEDEYVQRQGRTSELAEAIKAKEKQLWTNPVTKELNSPYLRVSDNNLQVIYDLQTEHKLYFLATEKHNKLEYLARLRDMIMNHQIIINPRCATLISHMKSATWTKDRKDFKRSPDGGHYDGVAALLYLSRNIDKTKSPYPSGYKYSQLGPAHEVVIRHQGLESQDIDKRLAELKKAFPTPKSSFGRKNNK